MQNQMEHLYAKYSGTGNSDTTKWDWVNEVHRDSYASHIGHFSRLAYMSVAENESIAKTKYNLLMKMVQPCGKPPKNKDEEMKD